MSVVGLVVCRYRNGVAFNDAVETTDNSDGEAYVVLRAAHWVNKHPHIAHEHLWTTTAHELLLSHSR